MMIAGKNLSAAVEAILFVYGEPMALARLAAAADASEEETRSALAELVQKLDGRGLILIEKDGAWQMGTHPSYVSFMERLARDQFGAELSRPAMETIAVIAYKGPISRADIEYIRGVNSSFTLRALLMRGLIERTDNPRDSKGFLYRASMDFLKHLGLARMEDLPRYEELSKISVSEQVSDVGIETRGVPAQRERLASPDAPVSHDEL